MMGTARGARGGWVAWDGTAAVQRPALSGAAAMAAADGAAKAALSIGPAAAVSEIPPNRASERTRPLDFQRTGTRSKWLPSTGRERVASHHRHAAGNGRSQGRMCAPRPPAPISVRRVPRARPPVMSSRRHSDAVLVNGRTSAAHRENYTERGYTPHLECRAAWYFLAMKHACIIWIARIYAAFATSYPSRYLRLCDARTAQPGGQLSGRRYR